ncbi:MAG: adenylosuccinate synthetase [Polyangiales bacterium]
MSREAWVVVDLGYGDQGKGTVVDFLTRDRGATAVVRFNGGAQAGHNVVTDDGRHHTFSQFGAGSFVAGVETWLTADFALQPWAMVFEAEHLARAGVDDVFERTFIDPRAVVITPFHGAANRLRERARGVARHGSCGVGVGEAVSDARAMDDVDVVRARDLFDERALRAKLSRAQRRKRRELATVMEALRDDPSARDDLDDLDDPCTVDAAVELLADFTARARLSAEGAFDAMLRREAAVIFEGAQGVLLDEWRGFHPYTTWSTCTPELARRALRGYDGRVTVMGVARAYATRHGAGPFVTEDAGLTRAIPDAHNATHPWQGAFRVGCFDAVATRYAIAACGGVDTLAVTCLDRLTADAHRIATAYARGDETITTLPMGERGDLAHQESLTASLAAVTPVYETVPEGEMASAIERACGARVTLTSEGPTAESKRWR